MTLDSTPGDYVAVLYDPTQSESPPATCDFYFMNGTAVLKHGLPPAVNDTPRHYYGLVFDRSQFSNPASPPLPIGYFTFVVTPLSGQ